ncbi:MAG TPA: FemAB family XrtA/PEP-CTERM system-associated protein [Steroidobacteraceae bacterium]|nr:FemAB family XrtA/PEP-CTERM system-associated protein [Steroidobacteraceae bacterium]
MSDSIPSQRAALEITVRSEPGADWDSFVDRHPDASIYLKKGWSLLARDVFRHSAYFLEARDGSGALQGVLPIVQQKSLLLGNFATSVPFYNYGGALAESEAVALALMDKGVKLARDRGCSYLEYRDARQRPGTWTVRTDKVSMILDLPPTFAELSKNLGSKLRSQAKRADREEPSVKIGSTELLDSFYDVFAQNMRDLGTPVYPKKFFAAILERFRNHTTIVLITSRGVPAAAAFLVVANGRAEIPWASCRADMKPLGFNMKLYWEVLQHVCDLKCTSFDFGRSTINAGTYNFKKQWGAQPVQLYWHRWERSPRTGSQPRAEGEERGLMYYATQVWRRLPLPIANTVGPWFSPNLPW